MIWKFQCSPVDPDMGDKRNYPVATPTVHGGKAFYGIGNAPDTGYGDRVGHFWCIDLSKKGDVSPPKLNFDPKAPENKDSALVWHYGGKINPRPKLGRPVHFGPTMSSACVHDGLVYVCEEAGYLHCLDEKTGKKVWEHDFKTGVWGSAYYADGRVFVGTEDGDVVVFAAGPKKKVLETIYMEEKIQSTPVAANGVLYVTTVSKVYAIGKK
jgi:outer membrane protein assembly factor BamB